MKKETILQVVYIEEGADLDAFSSAYGITLLYPEAKILLPHALSPSVRLTINRFKDLLDKKTIRKKDLSKIDRLFLVDTSNIKKARQYLKNYLTEKTAIDIYDHHPTKLRKSENLNLYIKKTGSATTIIVEKIREKGVELKPEDSTLLLLGIYEDTGSFTYNITTSDDLKAAAFLLERGADLETVRTILERRIDEKQINIVQQLIENIQYFPVKDKKIIISVAYSKEYIPDISAHLHLIKPFQEVDAFFAIINASGKISIIGRSKTKDINVGKILSFLGGGGHYAAGSAMIKGMTTQEIKTYLENILIGEFYRDQKISNIMYRNVIKVEKSRIIKELKDIIQKVPVIFVVNREGKFEGIALSKVLKESIRHGIDDISVENFVIDNVVTFEESMPVAEAEKYLINSSQDYFPVLRKGYPVGIVSRNYLLKVLHGQVFDFEKDIFITRERIKPKYLNYREKLQQHLPDDVIQELKKIGVIAKRSGFRAYLVGGIVRDIVMKRKNLDIDIIVEGDAIELVKKYAKENNYRYYYFEEFMTAQVTLPSGLKIDFATARKEIYEYPGAYPKVRKASIKEDLYRRDFTINTLAIEITEDNFGTLIDFFNGLRDIKDKVIRILHQLSFIEDPVRILRAVRFAGRFGFKIGKMTERLLKLAVDENLLLVAPTGRVNTELSYSFNEEKATEIIYLMNRYKILHQLIPEFVFDDKREEVINRLRDMIVTFEIFFGHKVDRVANYLLALMYHLPLDISYQFLERYHFSNGKQLFKLFFSVKGRFRKIPEKNSELYMIIKNIKKDVLVFLCSYLPAEISERIIYILKKEEERKLLITGNDLKELGLKPSPLFKEILDEIFLKYLDGEIKNRREALEYLKNKYKLNEI
ncbi:MAG TPA: CBS domain-containing protein [Persephonella sp.]|uniref:CBS domain-containing protein n=1 Tax=Persephonella sp. TaxID=2060922 RepID=UPI000A035550|nr:CBS domain-containing protein [Persephonella sp.]HCB69644.1 CBS domain-containing protein [Persephonella sp.]